MALLDDIGGYIDTNTSFSLGTDLYLSLLPESPDNCAVLLEDGGSSPVFTMGSVNIPQMERPELQIIVRNTSYTTGRALADELFRLLTAISNEDINGVLYQRIEAIASPALYERDDNRRSLFTVNFTVVRDLP